MSDVCNNTSRPSLPGAELIFRTRRARAPLPLLCGPPIGTACQSFGDCCAGHSVMLRVQCYSASLAFSAGYGKRHHTGGARERSATVPIMCTLASPYCITEKRQGLTQQTAFALPLLARRGPTHCCAPTAAEGEAHAGIATTTASTAASPHPIEGGCGSDHPLSSEKFMPACQAPHFTSPRKLRLSRKRPMRILSVAGRLVARALNSTDWTESLPTLGRTSQSCHCCLV